MEAKNRPRMPRARRVHLDLVRTRALIGVSCPIASSRAKTFPTGNLRSRRRMEVVCFHGHERPRMFLVAVSPGVTQSACYGSNGGERLPAETTLRTWSVLGHGGRNGKDVTVVWWPGLPDVM